MHTMLAIVLVLFFLIVIIAAVRSSMFYDYDDEIVTTTTTTVTTTDAPVTTGLNINGIPIVGMLTRQFEGSTPFVIDPVDGDKMYLNTKDDIYEDGAGKMWGLQ